ncbi:helix-turn-helix transcriptional regulator [Robiginitalea biformata]|uniref:Uncharacterized protein n=1 Tax=Robiginitalea biformata (strain ATCC BAA-864 / DSM 15991 / KCTC 12146 / HTCC2501) TaxID=313596 RepID=A4CI95_ROBBH|nr:WYL domain-containing protein [Robiginitalea biformata]EAR16653.1 hypothetical protein RB2501_07125 [Robiginitalea biformata HTCC2501]
MSINKNAIVRYHKLDECFSNPGKNYGIPELLEACNEALAELKGGSSGISRRQLYDDIAFMESSQGWSIELEKTRDGRRVYYRYADPHFSIRNQMVNPMEAEQLRSAFLVLSRFKGMPQFEWIEEMQIRLEDALGLKGSSKSIVGFETNPYLKGLNYFGRLFNAIINKQSLNIAYQGFRQERPSTFLFFPWYLKQYNSRWFLFGRNKEYDSIVNLALDRIQEIEESSHAFIENTSIDFDEYFEDIIGVTLFENQELTKIRLKVDISLAPYIKTKPLHGSQKIVDQTSNYAIFSIEVLPNKELDSLLLSFGDKIEVLSPDGYREEIYVQLRNSLEHYN